MGPTNHGVIWDVGEALGVEVGLVEGDAEGAAEGEALGVEVGLTEGDAEGEAEGEALGDGLGAGVGDVVGAEVLYPPPIKLGIGLAAQGSVLVIFPASQPCLFRI